MQLVDFFMRFMFYTPLCSYFPSLFVEKLLPALVGEYDFENCCDAKSCQKDLLRPSNRTDYTHFGPLMAHFSPLPTPMSRKPDLKKRRKNVYGEYKFFLFRLCLGASLSFLSKSLQNSLFFHLCLLFRWLFDRISLNFRWSYTCFLKKVLHALIGEHNFGVGIRALRVRKTLILHRFGFEIPS